MSLEGEDLDCMLNDSCSQTSYSQLDFDAILQPLSDSQQEREANLDRKEEALNDRIIVGIGERQISDETQLLKAPPNHISRRAPGLLVLQPESLLRFSSDLSLEADLGWGGRRRLEAGGLRPSLLDSMLADSLLLVRFLAPELGQTNFIASGEEFRLVADFLFYQATVAEEELRFSLLEKALFDLLKNCGLPWRLTFNHLFTCFLNLGLSEDSVRNQDFYDFNNLTERPVFQEFFKKRLPSKRIESTVRLRLISNSLSLVSELLTLEDRHSLGEGGSTAQLLASLHLLAVLCQDASLIDLPPVTRHVQNILQHILPHLDLLDAAELLTTGFMPGSLLPPSSLPWSYSSLPTHWGEGGINHPHNMLALVAAMPHTKTGRRMTQLICYLCIQLILGLTEVDLPSDLQLEDVVSLMESNSTNVLLTECREENYYPVFCLISLLDLLLCSLPPADTKPLTEQVLAIYKRIPKNDPLDLDPVLLSELATDCVTRWNLERAVAMDEDNDER